MLARHGNKFSKVLYIVTLLSKYTGALTFEKLDRQSFPHSASTYLDNTDEQGRFLQQAATLLVGEDRTEPEDVKMLRQLTNQLRYANDSRSRLPMHWVSFNSGSHPSPAVVPIANGHSVAFYGQGGKVFEVFSPQEEGKEGPLHFDTYMPVLDDAFAHYQSGRTKFATGVLSGSAVPGHRSMMSGDYKGGRLVPRLQALGLPSPDVDEQGLWRKV